MLIQQSPDVYEKLRHLGGMATDDVLSVNGAEGRSIPRPDWHGIAARGGVTPHAGVYRAAMPNGKRLSLLRVMFTDYCMMDCFYCPNSHWVPRKRYGFKVDELAKLFDEMHRRQTVDGLFLSSGIFKDPNATQERLLAVVETVRRKYGFRGYIHLKVMPGTTDTGLIVAAQRLGTRLSINMEQPSEELLNRISTMKRWNAGMLQPMLRIQRLMEETYGGSVGQATQLVVGAADETDWDIHVRQRHLYRELGFKRIYYSAFRPIKYTPLEEHPPTPLVREHRLYQLDWLTRVYRFNDDELALAFDDGFLDHRADPKLRIAVEQYDRFPMDINTASHDDLLRVPGIGPMAAERIVRQRMRHTIDNQRDLQAMGVVLKRALPFVRFAGHRPVRAKQSMLPLFQALSSDPAPAPAAAAAAHERHAHTDCAACPLSSATCGMAATAPSPAALAA
ncbi:MAG: hypothetical protein FJ318_03925 [SAR202 cluster bacterium]|nr:hypothetical protein [SAR202 cluster bacterium]